MPRTTIRACTSALAAAAIAIFAASASATTPTLPTTNQRVTLDGTPLGSAIANRSAAATILYDAPSARYHLWVAVVDETGDTPDDFHPLQIAGYRHATATDGVHFTSDGALSFSGSPFASTIYGSTYGEPAWMYPKASLVGGRYVLGMWTMNAFWGASPSFGDYNYNISLNEVGTTPGNLALTHQGPIGVVPGTIGGQTAGLYGIVGGAAYFDNNSSLGRAALTDHGTQAFPATASTGPWQFTGTASAVSDLLTPLGFVACQYSGGNSYVHNDARVLDNSDGTLGLFYTVRNCDGSRKTPAAIYYAESSDGGNSWGTPTNIANGDETIGGNAASAGYSLTDAVNVRGTRVVYFNFVDSERNLVVGAAPPVIPAASATPVPVDAPWMLGLMAIVVALVGVTRPGRRRRRS